MPKHIAIYTTNNCSYCVMVKKWLTSKNLPYEEINVEEHPERRAEAQEVSGARTVPVTIVTKNDDSKQVIVGWNPSQLMPAVA